MESDMNIGLADACCSGAATDDKRPPAVANASTGNLRIHRIEQLQAEALAEPDALQANLGAFNAGLMRIGFRLEEAIEGASAQITDPLARFERLAPAIDSLLKVMRQVDRFAQLDQRLASAQQSRKTPKPR